MSYLSDIAAMRQARQSRELADKLQQIRADHESNLELREQAYTEGDQGAWDYHDSQCQELEENYARLAPPQQPQLPLSVVEFINEYPAFFNKYGQQAWVALDTAYGYATRPFNPQSQNLAHTGMGIHPDSPEFKGALTDLFTMYSKDLGLHFDPNEKTLTPNEAADLSGVSAKTYNREARRMYEGGFDAPTRQAQQWQRKVG
jgi:hypothetical protein